MTGLPDWVLRPIVLGPSAIPVIVDAEEARAAPELAVLSMLAHGRGPDGLAVALATLEAAEPLDEERTKLYTGLAQLALSAAARNALEAIMQKRKAEEKTRQQIEELGSRFLAWRNELRQAAMAEGLEEGREKGLEEGREKGLEEGREQGALLGRAESVLSVLAARGVAVSPEARARILGCADGAVLDRWLRRAVTAVDAASLFAD